VLLLLLQASHGVAWAMAVAGYAVSRVHRSSSSGTTGKWPALLRHLDCSHTAPPPITTTHDPYFGRELFLKFLGVDRYVEVIFPYWNLPSTLDPFLALFSSSSTQWQKLPPSPHE